MHYDCYAESSGNLLFSLYDTETPNQKNHLRSHYHSDLELAYIRSGDGDYRIERECFPAGPGKFYIVLPNEQHCVPTVRSREFRGFNVRITPYYLWHVCPDFIDPAQLHLLMGSSPIRHELEGMDPIMEQLRQLTLDPQLNRFLIRRQVLQLVQSVTDSLSQGQELTPTGNPLAHLEDVQNMMVYINEHLGEDITVDDIIQNTYFSRSHMTAVFRYMVGITPFEYLTLRRVERVTDLLLTTTRPIQDIAWECGFQSQANFNRTFRRVMGMSPREYRKSKCSF